MNPDIFEMKPCWRGVKWKPEVQLCPSWRGQEYEAIEVRGKMMCLQKNLCPNPDYDAGPFCFSEGLVLPEGWIRNGPEVQLPADDYYNYEAVNGQCHDCEAGYKFIGKVKATRPDEPV